MANEQTISNLKKLKSYHNGSYGADIDRAIKALEQTSGDMVSRHAVIDACEQSINIIEAVDRIMDLPSVKPQEPKTGHWIDSPNGYFTHCSECGLYGDKGIYKHYGWCPKCGAKMIEPQERSEE